MKAPGRPEARRAGRGQRPGPEAPRQAGIDRTEKTTACTARYRTDHSVSRSPRRGHERPGGHGPPGAGREGGGCPAHGRRGRHPPARPRHRSARATGAAPGPLPPGDCEEYPDLEVSARYPVKNRRPRPGLHQRTARRRSAAAERAGTADEGQPVHAGLAGAGLPPAPLAGPVLRRRGRGAADRRVPGQVRRRRPLARLRLHARADCPTAPSDSIGDDLLAEGVARPGMRQAAIHREGATAEHHPGEGSSSSAEVPGGSGWEPSRSAGAPPGAATAARGAEAGPSGHAAEESADDG